MRNNEATQWIPSLLGAGETDRDITQKETFVFSFLDGLSFLNFDSGNLLPLTDFLEIAS